MEKKGETRTVHSNRMKTLYVVVASLTIVVCLFATKFALDSLNSRSHPSNTNYPNNTSYNIPPQYYVGAPRKYFDEVQNLNDLQKDVTKVVWSKPYQEGVFDCSEMSAYMERSLENLGWHTVICVEDESWLGGPHAWVLVEVRPSVATPVECTKPSVVWGDNSHYSDYFKYDHEFEAIQQAMQHSPSEFDWWNNIRP